MDLRIVAWCDSLAAPLSTTSERQATLQQIEHFIASLFCQPSATHPLPLLEHIDPATHSAFWQLQSLAGYNLAETLLHHLARLHILLQQELALFQLAQGLRTASGSTYPETEKQRVQGLAAEACTALTLLQGLSLSNQATKRICQRKSWMELFLSVALSDYSTDLLPSMQSVSGTTLDAADSPLSLPSVFALEMLMCILVDSKPVQDTFNEIGGLQQIVQLSHRCGEAVSAALGSGPSLKHHMSKSQLEALKQTDLHCLEFRYFVGQLQKGCQVQAHDLDFSGPPAASSSRREPADGSPQDEFGTATRKTVSVVDPNVEATRASGLGAGSGPSFSTGAYAETSSLVNGRASDDEREGHKRSSVLFAPAPAQPRATEEDSRDSRRVQSGNVAVKADASQQRHRLRPTKSVAELRYQDSQTAASYGPSVGGARPSVPGQVPPSLVRRRRTEVASVADDGRPKSPLKRASMSSSSSGALASTATPAAQCPSLHLPKGTSVTRRVGNGPGIVARLEARESAAASAGVSPRRRAGTDASLAVLAPRQAPSVSAPPLLSSTTKARAPSHLRASRIFDTPSAVVDSPKAMARYEGRDSEATADVTRHLGDDVENKSPAFATMNRRVPPSPAVRRAMARARSLSPQKPYRIRQAPSAIGTSAGAT
ncbi:hypothetical protein ACQY0O_006249 [Thecaphora frezii]